jgi:methionyl-tRNA synthetase
MSPDSIVDELHKQREEEMERLNYDFDAFYRELKEQERQNKERVVAPPEPAARRVAGGRR